MLDRLVGDHGHAGATLDLVDERTQICADVGVESRFLDQRFGDGGIPAGGSQDDRPLG